MEETHDTTPTTTTRRVVTPDAADEPEEERRAESASLAAVPRDWRARGAALRAAARLRAEQAAAWARKDSTRMAATAAAGVIASAAVAAFREQRSTISVGPNGSTPASATQSDAPTRPASTMNIGGGSFYPTPERTLRLDGMDQFVEWPHHEIRSLVVGVHPTSGLTGNHVLVRWEGRLPQSLMIAESSLDGTWRRPVAMDPPIPLELRVVAPRVVGFRFLDPGNLRTGRVEHRPQAPAGPPSAGTIAKMLTANARQADAVIRNLRA